MFISTAYAQETAAQVVAAGPNWTNMTSFLLLLFILYFVLIRPQQKRIKNHEMAIKAIIKGVKVIVGGIEGTVTKVIDDEKVEVEIADGVRVIVVRNYILQVLLPQTEKKK